jgi:uncharacterized membrane protein YkoI
LYQLTPSAKRRLEEPKIKKKTIMKIKTLICAAMTAGLLTGCCSEKSEGHAHKHAKLMAEAKVSKDDAEKTALAKVPNGTIKEGELEKENGKLQWSFDVATPDSKDITEVNIDAVTGEVISADKESAESEAKEAAKDKKDKKGDDKD